MVPANSKPDAAVKLVVTNRRAFRDYHVLDRFEAGLELRGAEVKSLRDRRCSLNESFADVDGGEALLHGFHILPYACARAAEQDPARPKRLLLHRKEIDRLLGQAAIKGQTIIPIRVYFRRGIAKVELALCKGKHAVDKRDALRRKTADREAERAIRGRNG